MKTYSFLLAGPDGWMICKQFNVQGNLSKHFAWPVVFYKTTCIISYWKCSLGWDPPPSSPWGGIKNFAGMNFFIRWWEPEEEWFWPLGLFSKLKATSCKYRALIKTKIGMTCAGFYPSTFMCSRFSQKNQFLCCLLSPVALWGSPMVDTKGKIFELYVCWSLENTFGWIFLGISEFYDEFGRKVARKIYATFLYACL